MSVSLSSAAAVEEKRRRLARLLEERAALPQPFPLSFTQQRLWFLDQLDPGSPAYQLSAALHLRGLLRPAALEASLREIVRRHKVLRTRFATHEGEPVQIIDRHVDLTLPVVDLSGLPEGPRQGELRCLVQGNLRTLFDLRHGHLFRSTLLCLGERQHAVLLATHHIISDGWSMGVIVKELAALYPAFCAGRPSPLPRLPLQYVEHAVWQRRWLTGDVLDAQLGYWKERLNGAASLELPTDHPRPTVQTFRGAAVPFSCPLALRDALAGLGRQQRATLFMTLLAVFQTLLGRFSGQEDVSVGSPVANRGRRELELLIGFFANTLVLRADLSGDPPFRELLARVRETALGAFAHQDMPLEKLVQEVQPERNLARPPLFQVLFALQTAAELVLELPDLALEPIEAERDAAKLELSLELAESSRGIQGVLEYNTDLFERSTAARLLGCFERLLEAVLAAPEQRLSELPLLSPGERHQILAEWNDTAAAYPGGLGLQELFEAQVRRSPEAVALVFEGEELRYGELNARANRLAHLLRRWGVGPGVRVGVCLERSPEMVVGLLAALKAGGAYVPLDPAYPRDRLAFLLTDARVPVLLTQERLLTALAALQPQEPGAPMPRILCLDGRQGDLAGESAENPSPLGSADELAYVIYTSGSTGRPKGAMNSHRAICNRLLWLQAADGLTAEDRVLQKTPFSFDISVWEFFWPLATGARLVLARPGGHQDPDYLARLIAQAGITTVHFVPSMLQVFLEAWGVESCASLRRVICSGEALTAQLARRLFARFPAGAAPVLYNLYGPTEAAVEVTAWRCEPESRLAAVPIGRPIANTQALVLDAHLRAVPIGVPGELYLGGVQLARGYLDRPDLTAERFLPDPSAAAQSAGARLYRTGDQVRRLPGGEIVYLGRLDHQMKVRGFRIEPGEIEAALLAHGAVRSAVVLPRQDGGSLVAYVETARGGVSAGELRELLRGRLPEHMVPAAYVLLGAMPLTVNGKLDRKALALLPLEPGEPGVEVPRTPTEELVAGIFAEVLKLEGVRSAADFFALGGHSLLATQVASRVRAVFGVELPVRAVFEAPMVAGLAARIESQLAGGRAAEMPAIPQVPRQGRLELSFAQQRLWFLDQLDPGSPVYNVPAVVELSGQLAVAVLAAALAEVVRRHEGLRTTFRAVASEPVQVVAAGAEAGLAVIDLGCLPAEEREREASRLAAAEARRPFDLSGLRGGPLLRSALLRLGATQHVALVTMHHIVSDGWSIGVLVREFGELYAALLAGRPSPLPELAVQYADFAAWQRQRLSGELMESELAWWRGQLTGMPPALELQADHPRPAAQSVQGAVHDFTISAEDLAGLKALSRRHGATLFMTLLAGFAGLLQRITGADDLAVGTPIAGRTRVETEPLIGLFVNTLVLRLDLSGDPETGELLRRVRETTLSAYAHQELPFERLVEDLAPERDLSRPPLVQVLFVVQNTPAGPLKLPGLELKASVVPTGTARLELTCGLAEAEGGLEGSLEYRRDLFEEPTMARLAGHFTRLLAAAVADPERPLAELPMLSPGERHQVLAEHNDTAASWSGVAEGRPLHALVAAQAARTPEAVAASYEGDQLTYRELVRRAQRLAGTLTAHGVAADGRVGVLLERSLEMIVALLGVLEAGAAYVPLEPSLPAERLALLVENAGLAVIVTVERLAGLLKNKNTPLVFPSLESLQSFGSFVGRPVVSGQSLAYVLYTSGSTGAPKGVMIPHRGIVNRLLWMQEAYGLRAEDRVLQKTPFGFDVSLWEFFWPLLTGARLVFAQPEGHKDPRYLVDLIAREGITTLHFVPSMLEVFLEALGVKSLPSLRRVMASGEALPPRLVERFFARFGPGGAELHNLYGPTEASVDVSFWPCVPQPPGSRVPIGRPIANHRLHVVDRSLGAQPLGVPGELLLGGPGLARGYLERPDLTAAAFVPDPFGEEPGARLYRTGDLARWLADATVQYLGRLDHQVKVRGFRIELGEIEAALARQAGVQEAVVVVQEDAGDKRLVAYAVAEKGAEVSPLSLREALRRTLPEPMVPATSDVVLLASLPLTANGKVDRRALARLAPAAVREPARFVAPQGPIEEVLAEIWAEVLGASRVKRVGARDDFFSLGGHSLFATQVVSRVRESFGVELPVRALFEAPTVTQLAACIAAAGAGRQAPPILPVPRSLHERGVPLSFAQQRLWFLDRLAPGNPFYNMDFAVRLTGALDVEALRRAGRENVRRHESLRTTFHLAAESRPVQVVAPEAVFPLPVVDLEDRRGALGEASRNAELARLAAEDSRRPFDLERGPLVRACLLRGGEREHTLLISLHHIIADGWSMGVMFREIALLYEAFSSGAPSPLPELPIQYVDFAVWQREHLRGARLDAELEYWRRRLAGMPESLELPLDFARPAVESFRGSTELFELAPTVVRGLTALTRRSGSTLSMTLQAGFQALLSRWTGQEDVATGLAIANRTRHEVESLIGFFVNTLVVRSDLSGSLGFRALLDQLRETTLAAYAHQDLPFERLVEELQPERTLNRNPLIQVMVAYQNFPQAAMEVRGLVLSAPWEGPVAPGSAKFDLALFVFEDGGRVHGVLQYSSDLFAATTVRRLLRQYHSLLAAAAEEPETPVARLPLLAAAERHQLTQEWNGTIANLAIAPAAASLHELFAERARASPDATALVSGTGAGASAGLSQLSYGELNRRANRLAHSLRGLGVGPEVRVGLCLDSSPELVVGLIAVLEAGGAFVPLDPDDPRERLGWMLRDSGVAVVVTRTRLAAALAGFAGALVRLDEDWGEIARHGEEPLGHTLEPDNLAYVIYTSGSTGIPKGVPITHANVAPLLLWSPSVFGFGEHTRALQSLSTTFDFGVFEVLSTLLSGGMFFLRGGAERGDVERHLQEIRRHAVNTLHATPSFFRALAAAAVAAGERLSTLEVLHLGGEALSGGLVEEAFTVAGEGCRLFNGYGPTEAAINCALFEVERGLASVPIGRPSAASRLHVLDRLLQPVPAGVPGELLVGGVGLSRGYLGRPDQTAARFIPDPFGDPGGRLYRTGDLVRFRTDGAVEFLGRIDHQVKIRGFRIELGEIESRLGEHPAVQQSVVLAREDAPGDRRLVAYVVQDLSYEAPEGGAQTEQEWGELFDDIYRQEDAAADPTFNVIGWNSTYTNQPLPASEMKEWLRDTVDRILTLAPHRVLEIGCGTGMILFRVAPHAGHYTGLDLSGRALAYIDGLLDRPDLELDRSRVELLRGAADQLDGLKAGSFDTVILNSVVQYFPSADYLAAVVERVVELVRPGGAVFLGDLRSLPLLEAFHTSVELFQAEPDLPLSRLRRKFQARGLQESELVIDPAFFTALRRRLPKIGRVEVHPKGGRAHNELTRFRYQVVLRLGEPTARREVPWLDWRREGLTLATLRQRLEQGPPALGVRNVPNARLAEAEAAVRLLHEAEPGIETAGELRRRAADAAIAAVEPQDLWDLAAGLPYRVELGWFSHGAEGAFDAVFFPPDAAVPDLAAAAGDGSKPFSRTTNNPLQGRFARRIAPELRAFLGQRLPDYMVPSAFVLLDALPLTPHGKVDRRRLPAPDAERLEAGRSLVPPRNATEATLLEIWRELLGIARIGVEEDFFELGGHSLLATQAVSRVRAALGVELPLRTFFQGPSVAAVAAEVARLRLWGGETDVPPLVPVPRDGLLPLSFAQERLWFLHRLDTRTLAYNESAAFRLEGALDEAALRWSLDEVLRRHESLRTTFSEVDGQAVQVIQPPAPFAIFSVDLRRLPPALRESEAQRQALAQAQRPFDLARGPLVRGLLIRHAEREHAVLFSFHHIVFDGWSTGIFVRELSALYGARIAGAPSPLPPLPIQYADFAAWQRRWLRGEVLERQLAYWRERLAGVAPLGLATDRPRPILPQSPSGLRLVAIPPALTQRLQAFSRSRGITPFMTLLAAFQALLHRYSGQDDVAVGSPIANRDRAEVEPLIGFFVNMLVLRTDLSGDPSFGELLDRVRQVALGAYAHQSLPFEKLVEELRPDRDLRRTPLFQVSFQLLSLPAATLELPELSLRPIDFAARAAKFDLELALIDGGERLHGLLDYDADLFDAATMVRLLAHFDRLLAGALESPERRLSGLPLLTRAERHQLLVESGRASVPPIAGEERLHRAFERRARQAPDAVAVTWEGKNVTYGELDRRANRLAHQLRDLGVGPDALVGLCLERSPDVVAGILGTLKAGAAYVPIDPVYPHERIEYLLRDSGAACLVTEPAGPVAAGVRRIRLDELLAAPDDDVSDVEVSPDHLAYVIYTSGSTGRPKGVQVTHRNATRLFAATEPWFGFAESDVWTLFHSYAFDFSVWEIWGALLYGGRLVVVPHLTSRSPEAFGEILRREGVTVLNQTPSAFRQLLQYAPEAGGPPLRLVVFGGEALDFAALRPWFERHGDGGARLVNMYGITETTVHVTYRPVAATDAAEGGSRIGGPLPDLSLRVLDARLEPVPIGVPGELFVGGSGLARGYLGRPELTAERFIPDPFAVLHGERLYRSGDLARWRPGGDLESMGRLDHQVKIRGFRVELGEIESALAEHPAVSEVVVLVRTEASTSRLTAYVVSRSGRSIPPGSELRSFLRDKLPEHMVPSFYVGMERLPLTPHGKVDRRALPEPAADRSDLEPAYAAPRDVVEEALAVAWTRALGIDQVGIDDNFFALGGDSMRSVRLVAAARERGLELSLEQVFRHQTIRELSRSLGPGGTAATPAPPARPEPFSLVAEEDGRRLPEGLEDAFPLARLQAGMLYQAELDPKKALYHNVTRIDVRAPFDENALRAAARGLVASHPILRTSFAAHGFSEILQLVHRSAELPLEVTDLRSLGPAEQQAALDRRFEAEKARGFDWTRPPLMRLSVHRLSDDTLELVLAEHHAILDGWSVAAMLTELFHRYVDLLRNGEAAPLPSPAGSYASFVALERHALACQESRAWWRSALEGAEVAALPRAAEGSGGEAGCHVVRLHGKIFAGLAALSRRSGLPLKSLLLAAHLRVLSLLTGREDVVTGFVSNGRPEEADGDRVLGLFLNTLPLRLRLSRGSWLDLARAAFDAELSLLPYRRFPAVEIQSLHGGEPLYEAVFNYVHFHIYQGIEEVPEVEVLAARSFQVTELPLLANFSREAETVRLALDYDGSRFDDAQVCAFAGYYERALAALADSPGEEHASTPLLAESERAQLLAWSDGGPLPAPEVCLHRLFEEQAARTPEAVAAIWGERRATYGELESRAMALACRLQALGAGPEVRVGLAVERSLDLLVGILGILKAGAAYVPLDLAYPRERLTFMLEDSGAAILVTQRSLLKRLPPVSAAKVWVDDPQPEAPAAPAVPGPSPESGDLAYVIYTSGSTGRPKGVAIEHRSATALVLWAREVFPASDRAGVLAGTSICFDLSVFEIFVPLACGGTVILAENALELPQLPAASEVTLINTVPSAVTELVRAAPLPPSVRTVNLAGEPLSGSLVRRIRERSRAGRVLNLYGPTEDTTYSTWAAADSAVGEPTIGRPIAGTRADVLDSGLQPVPRGVAGELCLAGAGLARGYLGRPDLTAERFVPDPFAGEIGGRLYRTGDLALWLPSGALHFLGRIDHQVKIRGFRIELGEVESALSSLAGVQEAVVIVREDVPGDPRLVAYLTGEAAVEELRRQLRERLPAFMVPAAYVHLAALPLTPSGKVDRKALPAPDRGPAPGFVAPRTPAEEILAEIWQEVLGRERVGVDDNFFDRGGHSLLAVLLIARIGKRFGRTLSLANLFAAPTLGAQAALLSQSGSQGRGNTGRSPLVAIKPQGGLAPFFCVHPVGGNVLCYLDLARRLPPDQPFYALQSPDPDAALPSVEEMAALYLCELRHIQPQGPYRLGGWSMGGLVAFEMARQLERDGQEVDLVALIDTPPPAENAETGVPPVSEAELAASFAVDLARLLGRDPETGQVEPGAFQLSANSDALGEVARLAQDAGLLPPDFGAAELQPLFAMFAANLQASRSYARRSYAGSVTLFCSQQTFAARGPELLDGWSEMALGGLDTRALPGDHYTMLRPGQVDLLARELGDRLSAAAVRAVS